MSRYAYTVAVALFLALLTASHWKVYHLGKTLKQAEFNQAVAAASERARAREQALVAAKQDVEVRYAQLKKRNEAAAAGARSELERLRDTLAQRPAGADATASAGVDGGPGLEQQLLGRCAQTLLGLAVTADRLEAQIVGLQGYVNNVCLAR
jgi:hypothetical protein